MSWFMIGFSLTIGIGFGLGALLLIVMAFIGLTGGFNR